jgi:hypothetical protein
VISPETSTLAAIGLIVAPAINAGMLALVAWVVKKGQARADASAEAARVAAVDVKDAAQQVKVTLAATGAATLASLTAIKKTGEETHILVNNDHGVSLRLAASALRRVANLTKEPEDEAAATHAEGAAKEHDEKQRTLDQHKADVDTK